MQVIRVLGKLEPGGAQLALLRVSRELERRHGVRTGLLVGDATHDGLRLAQRYDVPTIAFRTGSAVHPRRNLQWEQSTRFAAWLADKLGGADLVHAHMVGAWWAVAQVIDPLTRLSRPNTLPVRPRRRSANRGHQARTLARRGTERSATRQPRRSAPDVRGTILPGQGPGRAGRGDLPARPQRSVRLPAR